MPSTQNLSTSRGYAVRNSPWPRSKSAPRLERTNPANDLDVLEIMRHQRVADPPSDLIEFTHPEGQQRMARISEKINYQRLSMQFEGQYNKCLCGIASSVIVLNALRIHNDQIRKPRATFTHQKPAREDDIYFRYTQSNFFEGPTQNLKPMRAVLGDPIMGIQRPGISIHELEQYLCSFGLQVSILKPENAERGQLRRRLASSLEAHDRYVIVNYNRPKLGQDGGSHFSPLGAYDLPSDSFLIMDVNTTERSWIWAKAERLFTAAGGHRGFLIIKEGNGRT